MVIEGMEREDRSWLEMMIVLVCVLESGESWMRLEYVDDDAG